MRQKSLSLAQCRFLGERLELEGFEQLLQESPLQFLRDFVHGFRLHIPYNTVHLGAHFKQHGKVSSMPLAEAYSEVYSGRGGSCLLNAPFLDDFLRSVGFRVHLAQAFNAAHSLRRDFFHCTVFAKDVEKEGEVFFMDLGTRMPYMEVTDVTKLLPWKPGPIKADDIKICDAATPVIDCLHSQYQLVSGKKLLSAFYATPGRRKEEVEQQGMTQVDPGRDSRRRRLSSGVNTAELAAELQKDDDDSLVMMVTKDEVIAVTDRRLRDEENGVWLPRIIYPAPQRPFDFDIVRNVFKNPDVPLEVKLGRDQGSIRGVNISGFGNKSGDFFMICNYQLVRCSGPFSVSSSSSSSTEVETMKTMNIKSEEELLELVNEEFPLLLDYSRDTLDILAQVDGKSI